MKPVRLPASATLALPRWALFALCLLYILPGLVGRDPWKPDDAAGFGIMWTMANGTLADWLSPNIVGLAMPEEGPLAFWLGAICIKLFGWLVGAPMAARIAPICFFLLGSTAVWYTTYLLGRRTEAQPLKLAFGGQPEPKDFGRTLADGALLIYLGCLGLLVHSHGTTSEALQVSLLARTDPRLGHTICHLARHHRARGNTRTCTVAAPDTDLAAIGCGHHRRMGMGQSTSATARQLADRCMDGLELPPGRRPVLVHAAIFPEECHLVRLAGMAIRHLGSVCMASPTRGTAHHAATDFLRRTAGTGTTQLAR